MLPPARDSVSDEESRLRQLLRQDPENTDALNALGLVCYHRGGFVEAERLFRDALRLRKDARYHSNLGIALRAQGRLREAMEAYRDALALWPTHTDAWYNLANALHQSGRPADAASAYRAALAIRPDYPEASNNLGNVLKQLERLDEAALAHRHALALRPGYPEAHWNLSSHHLLRGEFEQGWSHYEWRWHLRDTAAKRRDFAQPLWSGEAAEGRTILLHAEQGFGDSIQFVRYAPMVRALGWTVILEVPAALKALFGPIPGVTLVVRGEPLPPFDVHCPLLSLPRAFGTVLADIPAPIRYLSAEPERVARWRERLPQDGLRVGIVWQGQPHGAIDQGRSVPLAMFEPLARLPGVRLISLQKRHGLEQLQSLPAGMEVMTLGDGLGDSFDEGPDAFLDTAAVMMSLDLVISPCTAVAHLAGALGRPVWVLLKSVPDWRWMLDRDDSPWYPTARLFRQPRAGDWTGLFARMARDLANLAGGRPPCPAGDGPDPIRVDIAPGELVDKLTILDIKRERIADPAKRNNVEIEHRLLSEAAARHLPATPAMHDLRTVLKAVNAALWDIEDDIRDCERRQDFGPRFIALARSVYQQNDRRAAVRRQINELLNSPIVEEKSYAPY